MRILGEISRQHSSWSVFALAGEGVQSLYQIILNATFNFFRELSTVSPFNAIFQTEPSVMGAGQINTFFSVCCRRIDWSCHQQLMGSLSPPTAPNHPRTHRLGRVPSEASTVLPSQSLPRTTEMS